MSKRQCVKCPWKVTTDPVDIPNGYCVKKHHALKSTIVEGFGGGGGKVLQIMACHETHDEPCAGWLHNQLGVGNNMVLRLRVAFGKVNGSIELVGEQHRDFESTLPR